MKTLNDQQIKELFSIKIAIQKLESDIRVSQKLAQQHAEKVRAWSQLKSQLISKLLNRIN